MSSHRNPNAKPISKPKTGLERRGNADANNQASKNLRQVVKTVVSTPTVIYQPRTNPKPQPQPAVASSNVPKVDYTKLPQNIHKGYNSSFKPVNRRKQQFDLAKRTKEQRDWERKHTLEGQIDTEIQKVTTTGKNTKLYDKYSKMINDYWNNNVYNVDPVEFQKWYNANIVTVKRYNLETGKKEKVETFKKNAPPPPFGTDKNGNTVDITKAWEYCQAYDYAINDYVANEFKSIKRGTQTKYAGQSADEADSWLDVIRAGFNPNKSGTKALKSYVKGYIYNPLINADFKALGINTLWNLGETLDTFGVGVRAAAASQDVIGGAGRSATFDGQNIWWYDNSGHGKSQQRRLVALGADKLLTGSVHSESDYDTGGGKHKLNYQTKEQLEQKIKDEGLWDAYKDMEKAWKQHQADYRNENKLLNNIKSAYTDSGSNFNANTGSIVKDIGIETILDPTLVIGGGAKILASSGTKAMGEVALRSTLNTFGKEIVNKESQKAVNTAVKQFIKKNSDNLITKNTDQIREDIKELGQRLRENDAIDDVTEWDTAKTFEDQLTKTVLANIDSLNYKVIRSLHTTNELLDKADTALLKSVFAVPYAPYKAVSSTYKGVRTGIADAMERGDFKWLKDKLDKNSLVDEMVSKSQYSRLVSANRAMPDVIDLASLEETYSKIKQQPSEVWDELDQFVEHTKTLAESMNKPLADFRDGKITIAEYKQAVDSQIATISGKPDLTRSNLKAYIEDLFENAPQADRARIGKMYEDVMSQISSIENVEVQLLKRENDKLIKAVSKADSIEALEELSQTYFIRTAERSLPEEFASIIRARADELMQGKSYDESERLIRNFERSSNTTVDLNTDDVIFPDSVSDSLRFSALLPVQFHSAVDSLKTYFFKEDHNFYGCSKLRNYLYSIKNAKDMSTRALHEALNVTISNLMIRTSLGAEVDLDLLTNLQNFDKSLNELLTKPLERDIEYDALKLDNLTSFDELSKDKNMQRVLETLRDPNTAIGKALKDCKLKKLTCAEYQDNSEVYEALMQINDILDVNRAYYNFRGRIDSDVIGLTDRQLYTVIDKLFGLTKGSPKDFLNKSLSQPDKFIQDLDNLLVAEYGTARCSLDGARRQVIDFDPDSEYFLFKDYKDEITDPAVQERIRKIASVGHINPMNDIRMQMLYTILKDPTVIHDYNIMSQRERDVIFSDIETTGVNRDRDGLTSIAFKKWVPLDEDNLTLSAILDVIEDSESETLYKRQLTDDDAARLSDGFLDGIYAKHPTLANTSRADKLADYMKFYGEEADGVSVFASEEDMMKFINQYITDASTEVKRKGLILKRIERKASSVPCLVFHNSNGFDTKFLTARMRNLKVGIPQGAVRHLNDIERYSHNTLARLRQLEGDVVLTYEQKEFIKDEVIKLAQECTKHNDSFKFLDPRGLEIAFRKLDAVLKPSNGAANTGADTVVSTHRVSSDSYIESIDREIAKLNLYLYDEGYRNLPEVIRYDAMSINNDAELIEKDIQALLIEKMVIESSSTKDLVKLKELDNKIDTLKQEIIDYDKRVEKARIEAEEAINAFKNSTKSSDDIRREISELEVEKANYISDINRERQDVLSPNLNDYAADSLQSKLGLPNTEKSNNDLLSILDSDEIRRLRNLLNLSCQKVGHMRNRYASYMMANPYKCFDNTADEFRFMNIMRDAQALVPDRSWSYLSYDVLFNVESSRRFFNLNTNTKMSTDFMHSMKEFTDWMDDKLKYDLKSGSDLIVEQYESYYRAVIETAINYANNVSIFNKFAFLKLLKQPSTAMESYLMAQWLYDNIFKFTHNSTLKQQYYGIAPMLSDEVVEANLDIHQGLVKKYANGEYVPEDFVKAQEVFVGDVDSDGTFAKFLNLENNDEIASIEGVAALSILAGDKHKKIFNSAFGDPDDYISNFMTEKQQLISKLRDIQSSLPKKKSSASPLVNISNIAKARDINIQHAYDNVSDLINVLESIPEDVSEDFWKAFVKFKDSVFRDRAKLFDAYRLDRLLKSEDDLIAELAHTNGFRRVIPRAGDELHVTQVRELIKNLDVWKNQYVDVIPEGDHIILQLKQQPVFRKDDNGFSYASFTDSPKEYVLQSEKELAWSDFDELINANFDDSLDIISLNTLRQSYEILQKIYKDIDSLTDGASVGTLGIMATYSKEVKLASSFSNDVIKASLGIDVTGSGSLWRGAVFDKSLLGDYDTSWKLGSNKDDFDIFLNAIYTLDEVAGKARAEERYIDSLFGANSSCKFNDLAEHFTNDELFEMFKDSDEYCLVTLHEGVKREGVDTPAFEVRQLKVKDKFSLEQAKGMGAIYVPYDLYIEMSKAINNSELSNPFLKAWTKVMVVTKVFQLMNMGTWIRNWIDATIKTAGDEGSLAKALSYEFLAAKRLFDAQKIIKQSGPDVTEAMWKSANYDRYMSYDEFIHLQEFKANDSISGGENTKTKQILKEWFENGRKNEALGINGFDTLGTDIQRFEQAFSIDDVNKYVDKLYSQDTSLFENGIDKNMFKDLFIKRQSDSSFKFTDDEEWAYNQIAQACIDLKVKKTSNKFKTSSRLFEKFSGAALTPMSQTELIVRYSQLLALEDEGLTTSAIYKRITDTHFNYNNKTLRMKCLEAVVPYATFQYNNILYWLRQVESNPRMIRYLEHTYGELSFDGIEDLEDDNGFVNQSLEYRIATGGIPIGSGGLYFKLNPSYLDALNWLYANPNDVLTKIAPPIRLSAKYFMEQVGMDQWNIFSDTNFSHSADEWAYDIADAVPIAGVVASYVRHYTDTQPWNRVDGPLQKVLVGLMPKLFGAVKQYNVSFEGDFDAFQESLADDDKWYDANRGKVVDISERKHNLFGLNDPKLTFEERRILEFLEKGRLFDANKGHFVAAEDFTYGGLNRDWDFSKEGEWDEYCRLKKKYFGLEYDYNKRGFVKHLSSGGLNSDNLDWDTICDLNEAKGLYWDGNQNRFVEEKYLVKGGLNKEHMSFSEICAYQLAIRGKVWDKASHKFVKVTDPVVFFKGASSYEDWKIFNNLGFDPSLVIPDNMTYIKDGMLQTIDGKYVLSNNEDSNQKIFDAILSGYAYSPYGRSVRKYNYRSRMNWTRYNRVPIVPKRPYNNLLNVKGKPVAKAYTSTSDQAGLRMALSGTKAYDDYYSKEFSYNMAYRNPTPISKRTKRYDYYRISRIPGTFQNKFAAYTR